MADSEIVISDLAQKFIQAYPEFATIAETQDGVDKIQATIDKLLCLSSYSDFKVLKTNPNDCSLYYPFFMLVAHYMVINGYATSIGLNKPSGLTASSSIDSVSVSYQTTPYNNNFDYFFGQTPYGMEYLAYISSISYVKLINN